MILRSAHRDRPLPVRHRRACADVVLEAYRQGMTATTTTTREELKSTSRVAGSMLSRSGGARRPHGVQTARRQLLLDGGRLDDVDGGQGRLLEVDLGSDRGAGSLLSRVGRRGPRRGARSAGPTKTRPGTSALDSVPNLRVGKIRPDPPDGGRVNNTKAISSAGSHAGAALGVLPALAEIVAGSRSTGMESVHRNGAVIDSSPRPHHPLPWRNTPARGENHVSDAEGRLVYNGSDAAEMFRLYMDVVQADAEAEVVARRAADHPRRRGRRSLRAWAAGLASRVRELLNHR